jgi:hypothetical protein
LLEHRYLSHKTAACRVFYVVIVCNRCGYGGLHARIIFIRIKILINGRISIEIVNA